jgi:hypothetical protein
MDGLRAILGTEDRKWQALQTQQGTTENRHSANSYKVLPHATSYLTSGRNSPLVPAIWFSVFSNRQAQ